LKPVVLLLAGGAHALSLAWPFAWGLTPGQAAGWMQLASLAALVWQLGRASRWQQAAGMGWIFSLASLCGTFWWLFTSMHRYGGLPAPLAVLAVLALAGSLALLYAGACAFFVQFKPAGAAAQTLLFAALWTLAELARGSWFTGFPWGAGGYAHVDGWLAGYAPWVGVYGVGAIAAWLGATLVQLPVCSRRQRLAFLLLLALPSVVQLLERGEASASSAPLQVTLLQGNIPQDEKFQAGTGVADALRWYGAQLQGAATSLVVAPETAIPLLPQQLPPAYWAALQAVFAESAAPRAALIGMPLGSYTLGYTNSVLGLMPGQSQPYHYDKQHLVPFGEFTPTLLKWFTQLMDIPLGDFNRGALVQPNFDWQGQRLAANVCYEDLFGEELGARFADPAQAPTIFVNLSNIGWFGDSIAIDQHLAIARMRSLEFARPSLRATNTGATVIIDHRGVVTQALARHTRGALVGEVQGRGLSAASGWQITPYAAWVSRLGLWPLWALALGVLALTRWQWHGTAKG
jgi:apolipoprotein N-acyltransferase